MYTKSSHVAPRVFGGLLDDFFQGGIAHFRDFDLRGSSRPVNIQETDQAFVLRMVAPGMQKEDFRIQVDKQVLTISCEHREAEKEDTGKWVRREYQLASFKRSFTLNEKIDAAGITASYANGILEVTLPKQEDAVPPVQSIEVN